MSCSEGNVTSDRISMGASPLTGHCFDKLVAYLPPFQLVLFSEISWRRARCFSPYQTSSSNAHDDELGCHRLAAGGGFGRPARYFVHYIYSEDLHQQQTWTHTHTDRDSYTHITHRDPRTASTSSDTHTHTETHIHTDIDTHTETHTLPQLTRLKHFTLNT